MHGTACTAARVRARARGAALAVGLVLLLALTVLAVASVRTARRDVNLSADAMYETEAFEAAERAIGIAILTAVPDPAPPAVTVHVPRPGSNADSYRVEFSPANGVTDVPRGFSLGDGVGFTAFHFDVIATGTAANGSSTSVSQSYYVVGPPGG